MAKALTATYVSRLHPGIYGFVDVNAFWKRPSSPHRDAFEASRRQMLRDYKAWLQAEPDSAEATAEIVGTLSALIQIFDLEG